MITCQCSKWAPDDKSFFICPLGIQSLSQASIQHLPINLNHLYQLCLCRLSSHGRFISRGKLAPFIEEKFMFRKSHPSKFTLKRGGEIFLTGICSCRSGFHTWDKFRAPRIQFARSFETNSQPPGRGAGGGAQAHVSNKKGNKNKKGGGN